MQKVEKNALETSTSFSCPSQMSQSAILLAIPVKSSMLSYIWTGNHVRVKSLEEALGLANARPPGRPKFANAPHPGLTRQVK